MEHVIPSLCTQAVHFITAKPLRFMGCTKPLVSCYSIILKYCRFILLSSHSLARYIVHNSIWGSISIISKALEGAPFSMAMSFSDGTVDNSTGILYFHMSAFDPIVRNMKFNNLASFSVSEAQSDYCKEHNWDPEEPLCSRVSLNGRVSRCELLRREMSSEVFCAGP